MFRNNGFCPFRYPQFWCVTAFLLHFTRVPSVLSQEAAACLAASFNFDECINQLEPDVKDIDFRKRGLTAIPAKAFTRFTSLTTLDLSYNHLKTVSADAFFDGTSELRGLTLKLNNNLIESLGPEAPWREFFVAVQPEVFLAGNRFVCNCSVTWIAEYLTSDDIFKDGQLLQCAAPPDRQKLPLKNMPWTMDAACKGTLAASIITYCGDASMFPCRSDASMPEGIPVDPAAACISQTLLCDGTPHCYNRNDENPFICNGIKAVKNSNEMIPAVDTAKYYDLIARYIARLYTTQPPSTVATPAPIPAVLGCRKGSFKCYSGSVCVPSYQVCDGKPDCPDGADEEVTTCSIVRTTTPALSFGRNRSELSLLNHETSGVLELKDALEVGAKILTTAAASRNPARVKSSQTVMLLDNQPTVPATAHVNWEITDAWSITPTAPSPHPTMTFPAMHGSAHVNNFGAKSSLEESNFPLSEPDTVMESLPPASVGASIAGVPPTASVPSPYSDPLKPQHLLVVSHVGQDLTVGWQPPESARGGAWSLVAYTVSCEIQRSGSFKKKISPLLSTVSREHVFHHVYTDDVLKITVKAVYEDADKTRYECTSEPLIKGDAKAQAFEKKEVTALPSARHVNYPGKMDFEDTMGIAVGGSLAALMVLLIGFFVFKRRHSIFPKKRPGTSARPLRMRKVDSRTHPLTKDRTMSNEPIYSEPEYLQYGLENPAVEDMCGRLKGHGTMRSTRGMAIANPDESYVQVLGSDSSVYGANPSRACSEYSCYSISAGVNPILASSRLLPASLPSTSDYGSLAVYSDSDNCSMGYYYHNAGLMPRCVHPEQNLRHFGDTLTPSCHIPANGQLTISTRSARRAQLGHPSGRQAAAVNPALTGTTSSSSS